MKIFITYKKCQQNKNIVIVYLTNTYLSRLFYVEGRFARLSYYDPNLTYLAKEKIYLWNNGKTIYEIGLDIESARLNKTKIYLELKEQIEI